MTDYSRCLGEDCLSCLLKEVLPGWCDGRCSNCASMQECPCCNGRVRRRVKRGRYDPSWWTSKSTSLAEIEVSLCEIACTQRWQQRPVTPELIRYMAKELLKWGQKRPIKVRIRSGHTGKRIYELVNGEVRFHAAKALGWGSIRCTVKDLENWQAAGEYLSDNLAERKMPWEAVAKAIMTVEQAVIQEKGRRLDSRRLGRVLGRSKDWINDHKRALQIIQAHGVPEGVIRHYKMLRPLGRDLPFAVEEQMLYGIINENWTFKRVKEEAQEQLRRRPSTVVAQDRTTLLGNNGVEGIVQRDVPSPAVGGDSGLSLFVPGYIARASHDRPM